MQSAYEVLSDPQERAWYDTHRETILRGANESGEHYEHNVRVTTTEDILHIFSNFNRSIEFSDSPLGFYGALRELFDKLAREEEAACAWSGLDPVEYPSFGYRGDDYEDTVRAFYSMWNGFATKKAFSWKDVYNYSEAPDRQIRRMMEKENKRFRDEGIREFNDAVRSLVAFVRKRDPRFKSNRQSEAERQKVLRDASVAQAARSRAANQARLDAEEIPGWMKTSVTDVNDAAADEWAETDPIKEDVDCVVCSKTFKSEKQYEAHEKSKKHIKAVELIRRQMQREDRDISLDLQDERRHSSDTPRLAEGALYGRHEETTSCATLEEYSLSSREKSEVLPINLDSVVQSPRDQHIVSDRSNLSSASDEDYAPRHAVEQRLFSQESLSQQSSGPQHTEDESTVDALADRLLKGPGLEHVETMEKPKLGKAKKKRAKKAAQQMSTGTQLGNESRCNACSNTFPSRTQLFRHLNESGHDRHMTKATKGGKGRE